MTYKPEHPPAFWAAQGDSYDCTGHIGDFNSDAPWPMYSFDRPAHIVWNTIAKLLHKQGWSDDEIRTWLQSKHTRWALDGQLSEVLEKAAKKWAEGNITTATLNQVQGWVREEQAGKEEIDLDGEIVRITEHLAKIDPTGKSKNEAAVIYRKMLVDLTALKEKV